MPRELVWPKGSCLPSDEASVPFGRLGLPFGRGDLPFDGVSLPCGTSSAAYRCQIGWGTGTHNSIHAEDSWSRGDSDN